MQYSKSVIRRAEQILGYGITDIAGVRTHPVVDGVVYADLFSDTSVEVPGYTGSISKAFNGRSNGIEYYNEIHLDQSKCKKLKQVTLDLDWGSQCFFSEVKELLDWLQENSAADGLDNAGVESKKIEDFNVRYRDVSDKSADLNATLYDGFGFYIRRPLIIDVAKEQKDGSRYF